MVLHLSLLNVLENVAFLHKNIITFFNLPQEKFLYGAIFDQGTETYLLAKFEYFVFFQYCCRPATLITLSEVNVERRMLCDCDFKKKEKAALETLPPRPTPLFPWLNDNNGQNGGVSCPYAQWPDHMVDESTLRYYTNEVRGKRNMCKDGGGAWTGLQMFNS